MASDDELLQRGVEKIIPSKGELEALLKKRKIRLYLGIDPTAPKLHLGHTVALRKLQQFADSGHEAILIFGTGTILAGDPSQRDSARATITPQEIERNLATWKKQVEKIIDFSTVTVKYNGDWLLKLTLKDMITIASQVSAVQLFKRDMFQERLAKGDTVFMHETLYPLLQGYDSVALNTDLEIGGTDQEFNMLIGRELLKKMKGKEKYVLTVPLIMGTDGKPMSKTAGNCIWLTDSAKDMFGKLMRLRDDQIVTYMKLASSLPMNTVTDVEQQLKSKTINPFEAKKILAINIVSDIHGKPQAKEAQRYFETTFQDEKPEFSIEIQPESTLAGTITPTVGSSSEAKRLIRQGAVDVSGATIYDPTQKIHGGEEIKIGKKIFRKVKK